MNNYLPLEKFSFGLGDRFAHQGQAQLHACFQAAELGVKLIPVWNKSNREYNFIGIEPASLRAEADAAVKAIACTGVQLERVTSNGTPVETPVAVPNNAKTQKK